MYSLFYSCCPDHKGIVFPLDLEFCVCEKATSFSSNALLSSMTNDDTKWEVLNTVT